MTSLFNLFVNKKNKPTTTTTSNAVKKQKEKQKQQAEVKKKQQQKKNWKANKTYKPGASDPIGTAITDNYKAMEKARNTPQNSSNNDSSDSSDSGSSSSGGSSDSSASKAKQKAYKKWVTSISKIKDSNLSFSYKSDYNDLWNQATIQKQNDFWTLKEEVFLYTFHDKKVHKYINDISIDSDKGDIMSTCRIMTPYKNELTEYWIPGKTTFAIMGGTYDREVLFIGRVSEMNQRGDQIEIVGQNIGWKFKAYMTTKFQKKLEKLTVKNAVKLIFQQLGITKGKYHIDLSGIPEIDSYKVGEDCTIEKGGESVLNVPELTEVVENLKSYNIDQYIASKAKTKEVYNTSVEYDIKSKLTALDRASNANNSFYPSSFRQNYGVSTTYEDSELLYEPILNKIQGSQDLEDYIIKGYSGDSEYTYEDVLTNIASAIDAHFFIVDTTVCFMSFNALFANSQLVHKKVMPSIEFWQMKEGSFEFNVNQYGYYNTVRVKYKNGTVTRSYDDLVNVFDVLAITYNEPTLNYDAAMLKAEAYLMAHIRDFGLEIKTTILHTGKIYPGMFIKLKNPSTMAEGVFFVQGASVVWNAESQTLQCDLDLRIGPPNPDNLEVPEAGTQYTNDSGSVSGNVSAKVEEAAQQIIGTATSLEEKAERIYQFFVDNVKYSLYYDSRHSVAKTLQGTASNCFDTSTAAYQLFTAAGIKCRFIHGHLTTTSGSGYGHYWLEIYYNGKWETVDLGRGSKRGIGQVSGKLTGRSVQQKNY